MAKQKLSELQQASSVRQEDILYVVQEDTSKSVNVSTIISSVSTANIKEHSSNLYFTNTRARKSITVSGAASYNSDTGVLIVSGLGAEYVSNVNGANGEIILTTANIAEQGNLYFTNTRVQDYLNAVQGNIIPASNIEFSLGTNTHRWKDLFLSGTTIDLGGAKVSTDPTTGTMAFVPAPSISNPSPNALIITSTGKTVSVSTSAGSIDSNVIAETLTTNPGFGGSYLELTDKPTTSNIPEGSNLYYTNTRVFANVEPVLDLKANVTDLTTANVIELDNLYYTNARVFANVEPVLDLKANVTDLIVKANVSDLVAKANVFDLDSKANVTDLTTANVIELDNLFFTNARVFANVEPVFEYKANVSDLTTANIVEKDNLFFNQTRARAALSAGDQTIIYDPAIGTIRANLALLTSGNINVGAIAITDDISEGSNNLYLTNARVFANVEPVLTFKANVKDLTTANIIELNNLYLTNARVFANVEPVLNLKANVVDLVAKANVTDLVAKANVTDLVAKANVTDLVLKANVVDLDYKANVTDLVLKANVSDLVAKANVTDLVAKANVVDLDSKANVVDLVAKANVTDLVLKANVIDVNNLALSVADLSVVANSISDLSVTVNLKANTSDVNSLLVLKANVTDLNNKANVIDVNNLALAVADLNYVANGINDINVIIPLKANITYVDEITSFKANVADLTTANIAEKDNLFFTNSRAISALIPGNNITIESNGLISSTASGNITTADLTTANVVELENQYFTNTRARAVISVTGNGVTYNEANGQISFVPNILANVYSVLSKTGHVVLFTDDIAELPNANNKYLTNNNVLAIITPYLTAKANVTDLVAKANVTDLVGKANVSDLANITPNLANISGNVSISGNLVVGANIVAGGSVKANNFVSTGTGVPTLSSPTNINLTANTAVVVTSSPLQVGRFSNTQLGNVAGQNGYIIYNTSTNKFQGYANGSWVDLH